MKKVWILHSKNKASYENTRLVDALQSEGFDPQLMDPHGFDLVVSRNSPRSIRYQGNTVDLPSIVLSRTGSGTTYFTLALMRQFEQFNVPVINDSTSVALVSDKLLTSQKLSRENLPMPKTILVNGAVDVELIRKEIGFPCVVKATKGSKGKTVHLCETKKAFSSLMELLESISLKKTMIIQEFIQTAIGVDLRAWVVGGKTIAVMKRTGPTGDFRANISAGGTGEAYEITPEVDFIARETARTLGLQIAGVDLLFGENGFLVCEANSSPGFDGIDKYCDRDMAREISAFVKLKLQP